MLLLAACESRALSAAEAIKLTNGWWAHQFSTPPDPRLIVTTKDLGGRWQVTYTPPPDAAGGETILTVDKATGGVTFVGGSQ